MRIKTPSGNEVSTTCGSGWINDAHQDSQWQREDNEPWLDYQHPLATANGSALYGDVA